MPADPPGVPVVTSEQVDGVPVLWAPGPAPFRAGLVFGVGRRDESFVRGGLTHLVEHLAMRAFRRTTLDCNASVDLTTTQFTAAGPPERVVEFLRLVCEALRELPLDRLAVEAGVLRTEDGVVVRPAVGALLAERYGVRGAGLAGFGEPAVAALTAQDVQQWADTRFVRGAAAVWMTGPPPDGLALPLRDGPAPARVPQVVQPLPTPALVEQPVDGVVVLGADVTKQPGLAAACRVLTDRVEDDLRHRRGVSYSVVMDQLVVGDDRRFVAVSADCREGQEALAARAMWRALVGLAVEGPTDAELEHDREGLEDYVADPRSAVAEVQAAAEAVVTGVRHRSSAELVLEARTLTAEQVRSAAQALRTGALVGVPAGVDVALPELTTVPPWSSEGLRGRVFTRRRSGWEVAPGARLVVGDDGASLDSGGGEWRTVRFGDAVGLLESDGGAWSLVGADGTTVPLSPRAWRDGEAALQLVRSAVPLDLQVAVDGEGPQTRQVLLVHAPPYAVAEALGPTRSAAWLLRTDTWTAVVLDEDGVDPYVTAVGVSAALGRRGAVLLLEQDHQELSVVLLHRGEERDRHVWTGQDHDPSALARVLDADPARVAALLAEPGPPAEVLAALSRTLGAPEQVAAVLAGVPVAEVDGFVHEPGRGVLDSVRAAMRGDFDPPGSRKLLHRLTRWENERPPAYRAANAALAAGQAAVAVVLAARDPAPRSRRSNALVAFFALGALGNLWSVRPPSAPPSGPGA